MFGKEQLHSRGFPTPVEENRLAKDFTVHYSQQLPELINAQVPDWLPTTYQTQHLLGLLYGIYFYDHVCGGDILSGRTTDKPGVSTIRQRYRLAPINSAAMAERRLIAWPIILQTDAALPCVDMSGFIHLPIDFLKDTDPFEPVKFIVAEAPSCQNEILISSLYLEQGVLTGIEEANHSHLRHLETTHYGNDEIGWDHLAGPLKSYLSKAYLKQNRSQNPYHQIDYNASNGYEYAAQVVESAYVRRYYPDLWQLNNSYRDLQEHTTQRRRQLAKLESPF